MALVDNIKATSYDVTHNGVILHDYLQQDSTQLAFSNYSSLSEYFAAARNAATAGAKSIKLVFDKQVTVSAESDKSTLTLANLESFIVENLVVRDTTLYSGSFDLWRIFDLTDVKNVQMHVDLESSLEYVGDDKRGLTPLRLYNCDTFIFTGTTRRCYQGYEIHNVKNVTARTTNYDTRYPHSLTSIGTVDINTVNNGCRRDFFLQDNCSGGQITVDAIDTQQGTPVKMYFYNDNMNNEISNLVINYKYRSTGRYDSILPARTPPIWLEWGWDSTVTQPIIRANMRNISINYDVQGGTWNSVVGTRKLIDESVGDVIARGYTYSGIKITGRIELGGSGNGYFFNFRDAVNWKAGDAISRFMLEDLTVIKRNGGNVVVNTDQLVQATNSYGDISFRNVVVPAGVTESGGNYSLIKFTGCTFSDFISARAVPDSLQSASTRVVFNKAAGDARNFKLGTMSLYRSTALLSVRVQAHSPSSGITNAWYGTVTGSLVQGSTAGASTMEGQAVASFTKGTLAAPTLSVNAQGEVFLNLINWDSLEAVVAVDVSMQYNEYSGGNNKTVRGMLSQANGGFSLV